MHIAIDATPVWGPPVGQFTYMANLVPKLLALAPDHQFTVYCRKEVPEALKPVADRAQFQICGFQNRKLCEQLSIPVRGWRTRHDLTHMCWARPYFARGKSVVTVHGLEFWTHPDIPLHSPVNKIYYQNTIEYSTKRATRLIAISEFIRQSLIDKLNIAPEKIDLVHHGVNPANFHVIEDARLLAQTATKYNLPERFILFVGAMVANKNLERLLHAFKATRAHPGLGDVGMVIAGGSAWNSKPLLAKVDELGLKTQIHFTGFIPEADLLALYNLATVYAFPSLVEGFGMPLLEAFACGTAVVTSNVSAMREIGADTAVLIDPLSIDSLADGLIKVLCDDALRQDMVARSLKRAAEFTWERTARKTLDAYETALAR